jgi:DNA invertase Pin-like site-specific DNA recombinase
LAKLVSGETLSNLELDFTTHETSTSDQIAGFDAQLRDLKTAGCTKIFAEQVSSVAEREQLKSAIDYLREGDVS